MRAAKGGAGTEGTSRALRLNEDIRQRLRNGFPSWQPWRS